MNRVRTLLAAATVAISAAPALAADAVPVVVPMTPPVVAPVPVPVAYDWSGFYVGVFGGMQWSFGPPPFVVGAEAGFNFQPGRFVLGVRANVGGYVPGFDFNYGVEGLAGVTLGATGRVLAYGTAGINSVPCCVVFNLQFAGGIEFGINDRLSVYTEARYLFGGVGFRVGVNFHL